MESDSEREEAQPEADAAEVPTDRHEPSPDQPTAEQEELMRALDEQMSQVRMEDMVAQSLAGILNLAARRIVKEDERDLDQARMGIDAARAMVVALPPELQQAIRPALSELQMLFARQAGGGAPEPAEDDAPQSAPPDRPSGLWTPPGA